MEYIFFGEPPPARLCRRVYRFPFIAAFGAEVDNAAAPFLRDLPFAPVRCRAVSVDNSPTGGYLHRARLPFSGKNVTVAVIDTGIMPHLDFTLMRNRIAAFTDCTAGESTPYDDNGHGTAVCGALAGNGAMSCGAVRAAAYKADLAVVKAIGASGEGNALHILDGMQWIYTNRDKYNIRVVNMSFGSVPLEKNDPLVLGAEALWKCGLTVVASAGNQGPQSGTILSPAVSPRIITVGGADKNGAAEFSSRGPAGVHPKPDLLAPAQDVLSTHTFDYAPVSGTSVAAPQVSALAALACEVAPGIAPDKVKQLLIEASTPVAGCAANVCGAGIVDPDRFCRRLIEEFIL